MPTIALSGGGTGGHIMPAIAVGEELKKYFDRIIFFGGDGMEKDIVPHYGLPLYTTAVAKFNRQEPLDNLKIPFVLANAAKEAKDILKRENAELVFGKGGYASLPAALGARALGIPIVIHESDYTMGIANKFISSFADLVFTSFPETKGGNYVGNPIRKEIFEGNPSRARIKYNIPSGRKVILVFGGSSGSLAINEAVFGALDALSSNYEVIHIVGKSEKTRIFKQHYRAITYADDIADLYAVADILIMRGGANSLAEAAALGKRSICVPLPKSSSSRGDQVSNALSYYKRGLTDYLSQEELTSEELLKRIDRLCALPPPPPSRGNAAELISKMILNLLSERRTGRPRA